MEHPNPEPSIQCILDRLILAERVAAWCRRNDFDDFDIAWVLEDTIRQIIDEHGLSLCESTA